jgi:hypothetical protein
VCKLVPVRTHDFLIPIDRFAGSCTLARRIKSEV